jgi:IstB-like ATP binding protein
MRGGCAAASSTRWSWRHAVLCELVPGRRREKDRRSSCRPTAGVDHAAGRGRDRPLRARRGAHRGPAPHRRPAARDQEQARHRGPGVRNQPDEPVRTRPATRCWSSTRSATSRSSRKPRTCSSSSSPAATRGPASSSPATSRSVRWGEVFGDDTVAAAMIDRLVHHADVIALKGDSYRLKDRDLGRVPAAATEPG